jgi:hypothetical protein
MMILADASLVKRKTQLYFYEKKKDIKMNLPI